MINNFLIDPDARHLIYLAFAEDGVRNDVTSQALIPASLTGQALLQAKAAGVVAGLAVFRTTFLLLDSSLVIELKFGDGDIVKPGDVVATVTGNMRSILAAERVALIFVCHLSGVATLTARYVS